MGFGSPRETFLLFEAITTKPWEANSPSNDRYKFGVEPVPLPQVITGWQSPSGDKVFGLKRVNLGTAPVSASASPASGPTSFSVTVA
jgi:hypothetical protein